MAKVTANSPAAIAFVEALGLRASLTRSVELHMAAGEAVTATVEQFVSGEQLESLTAVIREYGLVLEEFSDEDAAD